MTQDKADFNGIIAKAASCVSVSGSWFKKTFDRNAYGTMLFQTVLTRFIVVVNLHHSILYVGHFVISEDWKSDANL